MAKRKQKNKKEEEDIADEDANEDAEETESTENELSNFVEPAEPVDILSEAPVLQSGEVQNLTGMQIFESGRDLESQLAGVTDSASADGETKTLGYSSAADLYSERQREEQGSEDRVISVGRRAVESEIGIGRMPGQMSELEGREVRMIQMPEMNLQAEADEDYKTLAPEERGFSTEDKTPFNNESEVSGKYKPRRKTGY